MHSHLDHPTDIILLETVLERGYFGGKGSAIYVAGDILHLGACWDHLDVLAKESSRCLDAEHNCSVHKEVSRTLHSQVNRG